MGILTQCATAQSKSKVPIHITVRHFSHHALFQGKCSYLSGCSLKCFYMLGCMHNFDAQPSISGGLNPSRLKQSAGLWGNGGSRRGHRVGGGF